MDFKDQMIDAIERGECSEEDAYEHVRESLADRADQQRKERKENGDGGFDTGLFGSDPQFLARP